MTHEELVERVGRGLAHRHMLSSGTSEILHWSLFEDEAREAIRITGEACAGDLREVAGDCCDQTMITTLLGAASTIQSLTQGNKT